MIPNFPKLKNIDLADKEEVERYTSAFPPYSDFNFVSLWSYDTDRKVKISKLNENLVVIFHDYLTDKLFYSFIGNHKTQETVQILLNYAKKQKLQSELKLIPEVAIKPLYKNNIYTIKEDRDNFDYILSVEKLVSLRGNKFGPKRNFVNQFEKYYGAKTQVKYLDVTDKNTQKNIEKLFQEWEKVSNRKREETHRELKAIRKLFTGAHLLSLHTLGILIDNKLIGFSIEEIVHNGYAIIHFEKANISYKGTFQYLKHQSALYLSKEGCIYINYEQDLGINGLRKAKLSYRPVRFLKKYTITIK